jgi:hypothetical protein
MRRSDVQTRPRRQADLPPQRESIEAHLSIVIAALAVSRLIEEPTGWSIRQVRPHRPPLPHRPDPRRPAPAHRRDPLPDDLREALALITSPKARTN